MTSLNGSLVPGDRLEQVLVPSISCYEILAQWHHPVVHPGDADVSYPWLPPVFEKPPFGWGELHQEMFGIKKFNDLDDL